MDNCAPTRTRACETGTMSETPRPVVAAFDLDGSLTEGGSVWRWLRYLAGSGAVFRAALPTHRALVVGAIRSGAWADHAKERLFGRLLTGRDLEDVRDESRTFALAHLEKRGRAKVLERLRWHQAQGHDVVVVSASPQIYVDVIVEALAGPGRSARDSPWTRSDSCPAVTWGETVEVPKKCVA